MRVLVSGSTGLIGSHLVPFLQARGHTVNALTRSQPWPGSGDVRWYPEAGTIDSAALEAFDAVVHLAGENLYGRWTPDKKRKIMESRRKGTSVLSQALSALSNKPQVFVSASASGFYGSRGSEILTEDSKSGTGFLAEVCRKWEESAQPAAEAGIRVLIARFGVVLSRKGGALEKMVTPFRMGVGGRIGSGRQYMSWIDIDDLTAAVAHLLEHDISGPVNVVSPDPVTNAEFTRALSAVLNRPALLPVPAAAIKLAFGEMGEETILTSQRLLPAKLSQTGFQFLYPDVESSLRHCLT